MLLQKRRQRKTQKAMGLPAHLRMRRIRAKLGSPSQFKRPAQRTISSPLVYKTHVDSDTPTPFMEFFLKDVYGPRPRGLVSKERYDVAMAYLSGD